MEQVIAISRQYGSGGREIGRLLSRELNIPFYDNKLIEQAAAQSGIHRSYFTSADQKERFVTSLYPVSPGAPLELPLRDRIYLAQRSAILKSASEGPCVIVGRGASEILKGIVPLLRIFVYADLSTRIQRVLEQYREPAENIEKRIRQIDKKRLSYYSFYEEKTTLWTDHFDLCLNSGELGIERAVRTICAALR